MTRILVCGSADIDDPTFVHNTLCDVNKTYGPVTCVIHANHPQALAWQQWVSPRQPATRHLPIVEDFARDGVASGARWIDRLFAAKPDYVVIFAVRDAAAEEREFREETRARLEGTMARTPRVKKIWLRAEREDVPVLMFEARCQQRGRPAAKIRMDKAA